MEKSKLYKVSGFNNLIRRLGWRRSREPASAHSQTSCGTLAVYAGDLMIRSELLAELDAERGIGDGDTLRHPLRGTQSGCDSAD